VHVLSVNTGADTAGIGHALVRAFARTDVNLRSVARLSNYLAYPPDLPWEEAAARFAAADVAHLHQSLRALTLFGEKPFVLHHHGTKYRRNHETLNLEVDRRGGRAIVSTLDLLDYGDNLTWAPHPIRPHRYPRHRHPAHGAKLRVGHAPTDRTIKSTDAFLAACARLNVEPVLIERQPWARCLTIKGTVDILFDQVHLGYGVNAIEAWAMGIPVIAGAPDTVLTRMRTEFGTLPFLTTTENTLPDAIQTLMDSDTRSEYAALGQAHVARWHDGTETRARLTPIYRALAQGND
jgi:hypothetical protein